MTHRIVVLGSVGSGKSSYIDSLDGRAFDKLYDYASPHRDITFTIGGTTVNLIEVSGQEKYDSKIESMCDGANAAIIMFDIGSKLSMNKAKTLAKRLDPNLPIEFVGNKMDIKEPKRCDIPHTPVSVRQGLNLMTPVERVISLIT